jgi:hypothetical protein
MKMNKRGSKILSVYWFVILAIVAGGIFDMAYIFYGTPYDIRTIEASVLINQIADCVSYAGKINISLISGGINQFKGTGTEFLKNCHLNFDTVEWQEQQYYTEINFYEISNMTNPVLSIRTGNKNFIADCAIQKNELKQFLGTQPSLPQCTQKGFYSLDDKNNQYVIKILTAVRKTEKNAKL